MQPRLSLGLDKKNLEKLGYKCKFNLSSPQDAMMNPILPLKQKLIKSEDREKKIVSKYFAWANYPVKLQSDI